uniref:Uncharacterized protein n=1 Tax=Anguilla anguilla TaxID=7936 RepID=A0A0E9T9T0_ANGAN
MSFQVILKSQSCNFTKGQSKQDVFNGVITLLLH